MFKTIQLSACLPLIVAFLSPRDLIALAGTNAATRRAILECVRFSPNQRFALPLSAQILSACPQWLRVSAHVILCVNGGKFDCCPLATLAEAIVSLSNPISLRVLEIRGTQRKEAASFSPLWPTPNHIRYTLNARSYLRVLARQSMDVPGTIFLDLLPRTIECLSLRHIDARLGSVSLASLPPSRWGKLSELCLENCTFNGTQTFSLAALPPNLRVLDIARTPLTGLFDLANFAPLLTRLRLAHIFNPGEPETQADLRAIHGATVDLRILPVGLVELELCGMTIVGRSPVLSALHRIEITACTVLTSALTAPALEVFLVRAPHVALLAALSLTSPPTRSLKTLHIESLLHMSLKKGTATPKDVVPIWPSLTCDALILVHFRPSNVIEASVAYKAQTVQLRHVFFNHKLCADLALLPENIQIKLNSGTIPHTGVRRICGPTSNRLSKRRLQLTNILVQSPPLRVRKPPVTSAQCANQLMRSVADVIWPSTDKQE